jgi:hypothetical protein
MPRMRTTCEEGGFPRACAPHAAAVGCGVPAAGCCCAQGPIVGVERQQGSPTRGSSPHLLGSPAGALGAGLRRGRGLRCGSGRLVVVPHPPADVPSPIRTRVISSPTKKKRLFPDLRSARLLCTAASPRTMQGRQLQSVRGRGAGGRRRGAGFARHRRTPIAAGRAHVRRCPPRSAVGAHPPARRGHGVVCGANGRADPRAGQEREDDGGPWQARDGPHRAAAHRAH